MKCFNIRYVSILLVWIIPLLAHGWSSSLGPTKSLLISQRGGSSAPEHKDSLVQLNSSSGIPANSQEELGTTNEKTKISFRSSIAEKSAVYVIGGTIFTYILNNILSLGPIKASSITGLLAARLFSGKMALAALCGSFAGMAKPAVIPDVAASVILGIFCAGMLALFDKKKWLIGFGGRLGFIAQCACTSQFVLSSFLGFQSQGGGAALFGAFPPLIPLLADFPKISLYTIVGALGMSYWKDIFARKANKAVTASRKAFYERLATPVAAVGATGMLSSIFFPVSFSGPAFCGSFVAMSAPTRLVTYGALIGACIMSGFAQILLAGSLLGGWGGKLGTAALLGVLMFSRLDRSGQTWATTATSNVAKPEEESIPVEAELKETAVYAKVD